MSISLTIIRKDNKPLNIADTLEVYFDSLENCYINSELESNPQLYSKNAGVLGLICENSNLKNNHTDTFSTQKVEIAGRGLTIIKVAHENNNESRRAVVEKVKNLELTNSPFIAIKHTGQHYSDLSVQPPRLTKGGNIYLPVGNITGYFSKTRQNTADAGDMRGIEFANARKGSDQVQIINEYFSRALDSNVFERITDPKQSGLRHFTTLIHSKDGGLEVSFLQHRGVRMANYFFEPDVVFCSSECLLRTIRKKAYPNTPIKTSLAQTSVGVPKTP